MLLPKSPFLSFWPSAALVSGLLWWGCGPPPPRDQDGDGFNWDVDCDDTTPARFPGNPEICDDLDNDCNDKVDDDPTDGSVWYFDDDRDGFGVPSPTTIACDDPGADWVANTRDCDDNSASTYPNAPEPCNGVDDDCDEQIDEHPPSWWFDADGDGQGAGDAVVTCTPDQGWVGNNGDCQDNDDGVFFGQREQCNGIDDNCDGQVDESSPRWFRDRDQDGFGEAGVSQHACDAPDGYTAEPGDCDDLDASISPSGAETCNGKDDDCDQLIDEGC